MKQNSAFALILGSILTLLVLGSSIEAVPADAPWGCWIGIWVVTAIAVGTGIIGVRTLES
jgi:hypothetical protein